MAKGNGFTKAHIASPDLTSVVNTLSRSRSWSIRMGMEAIDRDIEGNYDYSDMANLREDEKRILVAYLSNAYPEVNEYLRSENDNKDAALLSNTLSPIIKKLNPYGEKESYRAENYRDTISGRKLFAQRLQYFKENIGKEIVEKAFISTGANKDKVFRKFGGSSFDKNILITIDGKNGKNLTRYNDEEYEVLFNKGSHFIVTSVSGNRVRLKEK